MPHSPTSGRIRSYIPDSTASPDCMLIHSGDRSEPHPRYGAARLQEQLASVENGNVFVLGNRVEPGTLPVQHGIQVNSVAPGLISSDQIDPQYLAAFVRSIPAGRVGEPDDIAAAVLMILQSGCTYLSGQSISVDGALSAGRFGLPLSHGGK